MIYRNYYIETDGKRFRAYKRYLFWKVYITHFVEDEGNHYATEFSSIEDCRSEVDKASSHVKERWRLVEPDCNVVEI